MIILGMTFAGKNIVGLNYAIECTPEVHQKLVISLYWLVELSSIILWSFYYQKLDKNWFPLQLIYFIGGIITMLVTFALLPESPKFLYAKQKYEEARKSLEYIASFNGVQTYQAFIFDNEVESLDQINQRLAKENGQDEKLVNMEEDAPLLARTPSKNFQQWQMIQTMGKGDLQPFDQSNYEAHILK